MEALSKSSVSCTERLSDLPRVTELVSGRDGLRPRWSGSLTPRFQVSSETPMQVETLGAPFRDKGGRARARWAFPRRDENSVLES